MNLSPDQTRHQVKLHFVGGDEMLFDFNDFELDALLKAFYEEGKTFTVTGTTKIIVISLDKITFIEILKG